MTDLPTLYQQQIHRTRYARWNEEAGRRETWEETVDRYLEALVRQAESKGYSLTKKVVSELRQAILELEVMGSMRTLMTAGKALDRDNVAGYNCAYLTVSRTQAFDEALYILCCGTGVGFSVERQYVNQLPDVPELYPSDTTIVVRDSKIGWASALRQLVNLLYAGVVPQWDISKIRPAGARLKTFGGRASGPGPLIDLFQYVIDTFKAAQGRKLSSLECHGIMCKIGDVVVVGGVRRSALISLSNPSDDRMRDAKAGQWWNEHPEYALANNSAAWTEKPSMERFMDEWTALIKSKSGERGIVNRKGMQDQVARNGRRDPNHDFGTNPCCVAPDTIIMTTDGPRRIDSLRDIPFKALVTGRAYEAPYGSWISGEGDIYRLTLTAGYELELTPEHLVRTAQGWVEAQHLTPNDQVLLHAHGSQSWRGEGTWNEGYLVGLFLGDGNFMDPRSGARGEVKIWNADDGSVGIGATARVAADQLPHRKDWNGWGQAGLYQRMAIGRLPQRFGMDWGNKHIGQAVELTSSEFYEGFLRGLFDADGHIEGSQEQGWSIRLGQSDLGDLKAVQKMLLRLGIKSRIHRAKEKGISVLPDGRGGSRQYPTKASWRLVISSSDIQSYAQRIGFSHLKKASRLEHILTTTSFYEKRFESTVASFEFVRRGEVWDAEVSEVHAFDANGIYAHNSEIILRDRQFCNLSEVVVRADDSFEDLDRKVRLATILGTLQATFTDFRYLSPQWKRNCEEERLLGVSLTGIMDHHILSGLVGPLGEFADSGMNLNEALAELRKTTIDTNAEFAEKLGINPATAITCVKPSGTVSQLVDAASGIHARWAKFYIRTNRASKGDPVAEFLYMSGIPCEDEILNPDKTRVFAYPMKAPEGSITRDQLSALDQLKLWLTYAEHWCEHKPSVTVYVNDDEWLEAGAFVYKHFDRMSGVSFLPHSEHTYKQAPYQDISETEYDRLVSEMPAELDWSLLPVYEQEDTTTGTRELACSAGVCDIL